MQIGTPGKQRGADAVLRCRRPGVAVSLRIDGSGEELTASAAGAVLPLLVERTIRTVLVRRCGVLHVVEGVHHLFALFSLRVGEARKVRAVRRGRRATGFSLGGGAAVPRLIGTAPTRREKRSARSYNPGDAQGVKKASSRYTISVVGGRAHGRSNLYGEKRETCRTSGTMHRVQNVLRRSMSNNLCGLVGESPNPAVGPSPALHSQGLCCEKMAERARTTRDGRRSSRFSTRLHERAGDQRKVLSFSKHVASEVLSKLGNLSGENRSRSALLVLILTSTLTIGE